MYYFRNTRDIKVKVMLILTLIGVENDKKEESNLCRNVVSEEQQSVLPLFGSSGESFRLKLVNFHQE